MHSEAQTAHISKKRLWAGRILSAIPAVLLLLGGIFALVKPAAVLTGMAHLGYPGSLLRGIGILEFTCAIVYLIPRTSILGAILMTGYLGGATATHVRIGEPFYIPVVCGVLVWAGLYLREERLRALIPLRS